MKRLNKDQRNYIIIGLSIIVLMMAVGYAAFASRLNINGTSEVTSSWNVKITDVTPDKTATKTGNNYTASGSVTHTPNELNGDDPSLTATFSAALISPGDTVTYDVTIKNLGSLKAKLDKINENLAAGSSEYIEYEITGAKAGKTVLAPKNDESGLDVTHLYVKVTYKDIVEGQGQPDVTTWGLTITLDFSQTADEPNSGLAPTAFIGGVEVTTVTDNDGLYYDENTGEYYYRGLNPNNYIEFNDEVWRIMSIESDGKIKIISDEIDLSNYPRVISAAINKEGRFDSRGYRDKGNYGTNTTGGTYCSQSSYGCNVWVSTENMINSPSTFTNGNQTGTVLKDSELKIYLNGTYYDSISTNKDKIVEGIFNIGSPGRNSYSSSIAELQSAEDDYQWQGKIALATESEYIRANTNDKCLTIRDIDSDSISSPICATTNYLYKDYDNLDYNWYLLTPSSENTYNLITGSSMSTILGKAAANGAAVVRPVLHLSASTRLTGSGTNDTNIFKIVS